MRLICFLWAFCSIILINKTNGQNAGYFRVSNSGAYMARFSISFNYYGNTVTYETGKNHCPFFVTWIDLFNLSNFSLKAAIQPGRQRL